MLLFVAASNKLFGSEYKFDILLKVFMFNVPVIVPPVLFNFNPILFVLVIC